MDWKANFLALFALSAIAHTLGNPTPRYKDIHKTTLDVFSTDDDKTQYGTLAIKIERVDQLVNAGESFFSTAAPVLLATRSAVALLSFDVTPKGEVSLMGAPVPMGMSELKTNLYEVSTGYTQEGAEIAESELETAFDLGITGMKVNVEGTTEIVQGEGKEVEPVEITNINLLIQITETNGKQIQVSKVLEQLIEIHPDGNIVRHAPCHKETSLLEGSGGQSHCFMGRVKRWVESLTFGGKLALSALMGTLFGLVAACFTQLIASHYGYEMNNYYQISTRATAVMEEKTSFLAGVQGSDEKLPIYEAAGFVLPAEKDSKF